MLCKKPYTEGVMCYGCGQCMPCRINKSREWTGRILLESYEHPFNTFLTLTYDEENCPHELDKAELSAFFKRLRSELPVGQKIRYYAVGEYGDETGRPHYHAIVFGLSPVQTVVVGKAWPHGFVQLAFVTPRSINYVASYVKKLRDPHEEGRAPGFAIMSRRPGVGIGPDNKVLDRFFRSYHTVAGKAALKKSHWIEERFRTGGKKYPLGRLLKNKLLDKLGFESGNRDEHRDMLGLQTAVKVREVGTEAHDKKRRAVLTAQEGKIQVLRSKRRKL